AAFREAVRLHPGLCMLQYCLAMCRIAQGKIVEAEAPFREALRLRPELDGPWAQFGRLLTTLEKFPEAVKAYRRAARLNPKTYEPDLRRAERLAKLASNLPAILRGEAPRPADANDRAALA